MSILTPINHSLVIIGSGPAGLTAATYAARAQLAPLIFAGPHPGGQLMETSVVENWPGTPSILGPKLMFTLREHALASGAIIADESIVEVDFKERPFRLITNQNKIIVASAVIIATGATPRRLACPGEQEYWGRGISTCAVCDSILYRDKKVLVVGGGDTAMEHASALAKVTNQITLVHIRNTLNASTIMQRRVLGHPHITIHYSATITAITGTGDRLTGAIITDQTSGIESVVAADGIFLGIGLKPNTKLFMNQIALDHQGYIRTFEHTQTSIAGIFAAGDVVDGRYRQAITSAGDGCRAALDAEHYLASL